MDRLTDRPDMTLDETMDVKQQYNNNNNFTISQSRIILKPFINSVSVSLLIRPKNSSILREVAALDHPLALVGTVRPTRRFIRSAYLEQTFIQLSFKN